MKALHHVGITVKDLDASIRFYHDVLGLPFSNEPSPWFDAPELGPAVGVPGAALRQVSLLVDDIEATKAELEVKGIEFFSPVNVVDEGVLAGWRWVYFADPDGYPLELVEVAYYNEEERRAGIAAYLASRAQEAPTH
jgi:catechol 2,3-dioxygenase-like lactoylglutathione lyase family enzyme